jgi:16S rRNA (adenine1518-N6/adenine1519-N6)-dimethyltransferase
MTQIELIKKYRLSIRGHLGQHLLIDPNVQRKIADLLELNNKDHVVEIGPGLGALTNELVKRAKKVWAIEKDARFVSILKEELAAYNNLELIHQDILQVDLRSLSSSSAKAEDPVQDSRFRGNDKQIKLIGNLPYYITGPILFHLLDFSNLISKAVLMMQKEVADRLVASPGSKSYGKLSILFRYMANVSHAFDVSPGCFTPRPEVESSVIIATFNPESARLPKDDEALLFHLVTVAFSQRRKTLLHLLLRDPKISARGGSASGGKMDRAQWLELFASHGFSDKVRGEELLLKDYLTMVETLKKKRIFETDHQEERKSKGLGRSK